MSLFQKTAIALARSPGAGRAMRALAARTSLARRFVGGADVEAAVRTAARLREAHGIRASLFYLGEYVADPAAIEHNTQQAMQACAALGRAGLDVHVSIDPTAIGYMRDDALGRGNARRIAAAARQAAGGGRDWVVLDMEDSGLRERTCALHAELLGAGLPAGLTLQARRRRTPVDLAWAIGQRTSLRLVKGAFPERALDHAGRAHIDQAYLDAAAIMLSPQARAAGFLPVFGTHDDRLAGAIMALARERGWGRTSSSSRCSMACGPIGNWRCGAWATPSGCTCHSGRTGGPMRSGGWASIRAMRGCWRGRWPRKGTISGSLSPVAGLAEAAPERFSLAVFRWRFPNISGIAAPACPAMC